MQSHWRQMLVRDFPKAAQIIQNAFDTLQFSKIRGFLMFNMIYKYLKATVPSAGDHVFKTHDPVQRHHTFKHYRSTLSPKGLYVRGGVPRG